MDALADTIFRHHQRKDSLYNPTSFDMADDQMDDMELGLDDDYEASSPSENTTIKIDETDEEKQLRVLNGYISSLPYPCESIEDMEQQLRTIVVKMTIAAEGRHWEHFFAWDGILASCVSLLSIGRCVELTWASGGCR